MTDHPTDPALALVTQALTGTDDDPDDVTLLRTIIVADTIANMIAATANAARPELAGRLGPGGSRKVAGLGQATVTAPSRTVKVTERAALHNWLVTRHPEAVTVRDELDVTVLQRAVDHDPTLLDRLDALVPGAKRRAEYLREGTVDRLLDRYGRPDPDRPEVFRKGPIADDDGEVIPGIEVADASEPQLRITRDKDGVARIRTMVLGLATGRRSLGPGSLFDDNKE